MIFQEYRGSSLKLPLFTHFRLFIPKKILMGKESQLTMGETAREDSSKRHGDLSRRRSRNSSESGPAAAVRHCAPPRCGWEGAGGGYSRA